MMLLKQIFRTTLSLSAIAFLCTSCGDNSSTGSENKDGKERAHEWSYEGELGPSHWGEEYPIAITGREQSPINVETAKVVTGSLPPISYDYDESKVHCFNNGHTIQANVLHDEDSSYIHIGDKRYNLLQFHFHTESENTVDGKFHPIEMHLVHKAEDGNLAVVGVFIDKGEENDNLEELWNNLPEHEDDEYYSKEEVDIEELLPEEKGAYRFDGSLTTPPCTEGVKWTLMADPIEMSEKQIDDFKVIFSGAHFPEGNRRPVQPLYERKVVFDAGDDD